MTETLVSGYSLRSLAYFTTILSWLFLLVGHFVILKLSFVFLPAPFGLVVRACFSDDNLVSHFDPQILHLDHIHLLCGC